MPIFDLLTCCFLMFPAGRINPRAKISPPFWPSWGRTDPLHLAARYVFNRGMNFFRQLTLISLCLTLLPSCGLTWSKDQGPLKFKVKKPLQPRRTIQNETKTPVPLEATYESLRVNLLEKSCLQCHSKDTEAQKPLLDTEEQLIEFRWDSVFSIEDEFMPERDSDGKPKAPIPSDEVLEKFIEWAEFMD